MRPFPLTTMLMLLAAFVGTARGAATNAAPRLDYSSFQIIVDRNIFNGNRAPRSTRVRKTEPERRVRIESFALTGTLTYEKGRFAFFEGSSSEYQKVLQPAGTIAGYKISDITPNYVKLDRTNGPAIELAVGMQMKRQDEEEWRLEARSSSSVASSTSTASAESSASSGSSTPSTSAGSSDKTESSSSGGASDVLKRLLEKREQESKNAKP